MAVATRREKPILFSTVLVPAVMSGRKTQTRRLIKHHLPTGPCDIRDIGDGPEIYGAGGVWLKLRLPYQVGDLLYVREACSIGTCPNDPHGLASFDDGAHTLHPESPPGSEGWCRMWKRTPSIHMPKWAARTWLEVVGVKVERLQDISEEDAIAEGIDSTNFTGWGEEPGVPAFPEPDVYRDYSEKRPFPWIECPIRSFASLWDSLSKPGSQWADNPWVAAYGYRRIER